eukprot:5672715-Amphidinium_carterae.2
MTGECAGEGGSDGTPPNNVLAEKLTQHLWKPSQLSMSVIHKLYGPHNTLSIDAKRDTPSP